MRMLAALISAALLASSPILADDKPLEGDLAKMQGKWTGKAGPEKNFEIKIEIKGKAVTVFFTPPDGDEIQIKGELKVDEKAKPHKTMDWTKFKNPVNGDEMPDNFALYEIKDDEFKVCSGGPGNDRPAKFEDGDDGMPSLIVFKKVKEEKKEEKKDK